MTMKKMISLALAACMALALAVPAYAADYACDERELFNETVNEYDLLKELNEDYQEAIENNTIQSSQFSEMDEKELDLIVNYQDYFDEQAKLLQTWTDEQLQFMGYTEERFEIIQEAKLKERQLVLIVLLKLWLSLIHIPRAALRQQ